MYINIIVYIYTYIYTFMSMIVADDPLCSSCVSTNLGGVIFRARP